MKGIIVLISLSTALPSITYCTAQQPEKQAPTEAKATATVKQHKNIETGIIELDSAEQFDSLLAENHGLIVIDFYGTWCGPCKNFSEVLKKVAPEFTEVLFIKVDCDKFKAVATRYSFSGVPYIVIIKNNQQVYAQGGAQSASDFRKLLKKYLE